MINWRAKYEYVEDIPQNQGGVYIMTAKHHKRKDGIMMNTFSPRDTMRSCMELRAILIVGDIAEEQGWENKDIEEMLCERLSGKHIRNRWYKVDLDFLWKLHEDVRMSFVEVVYFDEVWEEGLLSIEREDREWFERFVSEVLATPNKFSYHCWSKKEMVERRVYLDSEVGFVWVKGSPLLVDCIRPSED